MKLTIDLNDKAHLKAMAQKNPEKFKEFIKTWIYAGNELAEYEYAVSMLLDTAEQIRISPAELLAGIIEGCLNEQFVNEHMSPILGKELLPLALFKMEMQQTDGAPSYFDWRKWFKIPAAREVTAKTIASAIGNTMKYSRFLSFDKLAEALDSNQLITFKAIPLEQARLLPFHPALRYQKELKGEFHVGKFFDEPRIGFFDCGEIDKQEVECPACSRKDLSRTLSGKYMYCRACNAGYKITKTGANNNDSEV